MSRNKGIELENLTIKYRVGEKEHKAVDNVSLTLQPGKIIGLIGESGCGKSTIMNAILDTLPQNGFVSNGKIMYNSVDLLTMDAEQRRQLKWTEIACAFQYAQSSMNPVSKVINQFLDVFEDHDIHHSLDKKMSLIQEKIEMCGLDWKRVVESYPHELSGGMRQRVVIANSLILDPHLLLLDEPTTALDIITQAFIVDALRHVHDQLHITMLLISHDIGNIAKLAEDVIVMYAGNVVESGSVEDIFYRSKHPYTQGLIHSTPSLTEDLSKKKSIPGEPPNLLNMPSGCRFHPRCPYATNQCRELMPPLTSVGANHKSACFYIDKIGGVDHA